MFLRCLFGLGKTRHFADHILIRSFALQGDQQIVAIDFRIIGKHLVKIDYQAGATTRLNNIGAAQAALSELLHGFAQAVRGIGKIQCDTRRRIDCEPGRHVGQRLRHLNLDNSRSSTGATGIQRGYAVLGVGLRLRSQQAERNEHSRHSGSAVKNRVECFHCVAPKK